MPRRSKADEQLDFEISFFERLLRDHPDFIDALVPLGDAYTRRGLYDRGLQVDLKLSQLRAHDPLSWYNLGCSYSLLNRVDDAFTALQRAIDIGYTNLTYLMKDPDLINVRKSEKYRPFLESVATRHTPQRS